MVQIFCLDICFFLQKNFLVMLRYVGNNQMEYLSTGSYYFARAVGRRGLVGIFVCYRRQGSGDRIPVESIKKRNLKKIKILC